MSYMRLKNGMTVHKFCKLNNLKYTSVLMYLDRGYSVEDAVNTVVRTKARGRGLNNCKYFVSENVSLKSACRQVGFSYEVCRRLVMKGLSWDEICKRLA